MLAPACRGNAIYCSSSDEFDAKDFDLKEGDGVCWRRGNELVVKRQGSEHVIPLPADLANLHTDPALLLMGICGVWVSGVPVNFD